MPTNFYHVILEPYRSVLEDRAVVHEIEDGWIVAVADGAGGISHGDRAAEVFVQCVASLLKEKYQPNDERTWTTLLARSDATLYHETNCGQTTALVLAITSREIVGASVGDSEAWLSTSSGCHNLTAAQRRKPFLGSGCAAPMPFRHRRPDGMLLVATDGLFKYSDTADIRAALKLPLDEAGRTLARLPRLADGRLADDLGMVVLDLSRFR